MKEFQVIDLIKEALAESVEAEWIKLGIGRNCSKSPIIRLPIASTCILYTSDAADE